MLSRRNGTNLYKWGVDKPSLRKQYFILTQDLYGNIVIVIIYVNPSFF